MNKVKAKKQQDRVWVRVTSKAQLTNHTSQPHIMKISTGWSQNQVNELYIRQLRKLQLIYKQLPDWMKYQVDQTIERVYCK